MWTSRTQGSDSGSFKYFNIVFYLHGCVHYSIILSEVALLCARLAPTLTAINGSVDHKG